MTHPRAAIFDVDGLLMDTEPLWRRAEMGIFGGLGLPLTEEQTRETMGLRIDQVALHWWTRSPWEGPSPEDVAGEIVAAVRALILEEGRLMPGVQAAIETFASLGMPMAVASSSPMTLIEAVLKRGGLEDAFPLRCSAVDEAFGKPHPAVYLRAAEGLGVDPTDCIALEDSLNGILSAKSARMTCLAVPDPDLRGDPRLAIADFVLPSLAEMTPEWTRRHLLGL